MGAPQKKIVDWISSQESNILINQTIVLINKQKLDHANSYS